MNTRFRLLVLLIVAQVCGTMSAAPRSLAQMRQAAADVLAGCGQRRAPYNDRTGDGLVELRQTPRLSLIGYRGGPFAVIAADDAFPAVIGYSDGLSSDTPNPDFCWWLDAIDKAMEAVGNGVVYRLSPPDTRHFAPAVEPLCTSLWGQQAPFNNMCPIEADTEQRCVSGCVATAMAQIMYYHRSPANGTGSHTITYPYDDPTGERLTVDFAAVTYDWDAMIDDYSTGYSPEQGRAVAELMYSCGVASDMRYGTGGSGALASDAVNALRSYFGYTTARVVYRVNYRDSLWMSRIYSDICDGMPILYSGIDEDNGGHAFVLDGYDEQGMVHINWGWNGDENGYYNIALLNPKNYNFKSMQSMIVGIRGPMDSDAEPVRVVLEQAGTLAGALNDAMSVKALTVTGPVNSADLALLRTMAGCDTQGRRTDGMLERLDLSAARIVGDGAGNGTAIPYLIENGHGYTTADDELPYKAFAGCGRLRSLDLPGGLRAIADGAWAYCTALGRVTLAEAATDAEFRVAEDGAVYTAGGDGLICFMPGTSDSIAVADGVTRIHDYALAGCALLRALQLPSSLTDVGAEALCGCYGLRTVRSFATTVPATGTAALDDIDKRLCRLYVFGGSKSAYLAAAQWQDFAGTDETGSQPVAYDNIVEFGTTVTARNAIRDYGDDNPRFGYKIEGEPLNGKPELICEATPGSPVGEYAISIGRGTVTNEYVVFADGMLLVEKATLTATADDCRRTVGADNPEFTISYSGFRNGDTADDAIDTAPIVTTDADRLSPEGTYLLTVSGGEARNYHFVYVSGTLTVESGSDGIDTATMPARDGMEGQSVYTLDGRLVEMPRAKGIYISEGKKIVVR